MDFIKINGSYIIETLHQQILSACVAVAGVLLTYIILKLEFYLKKLHKVERRLQVPNDPFGPYVASRIFEYLDLRSIASCSMVSLHWQQLAGEVKKKLNLHNTLLLENENLSQKMKSFILSSINTSTDETILWVQSPSFGSIVTHLFSLPKTETPLYALCFPFISPFMALIDIFLFGNKPSIFGKIIFFKKTKTDEDTVSWNFLWTFRLVTIVSGVWLFLEMFIFCILVQRLRQSKDNCYCITTERLIYCEKNSSSVLTFSEMREAEKYYRIGLVQKDPLDSTGDIHIWKQSSNLKELKTKLLCVKNAVSVVQLLKHYVNPRNY